MPTRHTMTCARLASSIAAKGQPSMHLFQPPHVRANKCMSIITLLTDFGTDSPYVAAIKGVIYSINPQITLVDITHGITPQDIRSAAYVLSEICPRFPSGTIHLAVVDPGVGTDRELIYLEIGRQRFIGPDNGLFSRLARERPITRIHALAERDYWLADVSMTFHGRDIMAPVAARLSLGLDPALVGPRLEKLVDLPWSQSKVMPQKIVGQIDAIDSFGNLITNITASQLQDVMGHATVTTRCAGLSIAGIAKTYGEQPAGALVALVGSGGYLEVALVNGNAAKALDATVGSEVSVEWQATNG